jgi:tRNA A37 threonylcarbamoyladenosine modification protein TsaB
MAWLFLDTHAPGEARFAILEDAKLPQVTSIQGRTVGLLPKLAKTMGSKGLKKIEGVCVVAGPGSFSSVRAGVLDANMIARLLDIPLIGITVDEAHDLPVLSAQLSVVSGQRNAKLKPENWPLKPAQYVAPIYDKEPNITIPKKP